MEIKISKLWRKDTKILSLCFIVSNKVDWSRLIHLEVYVVYFYWVQPFAVFWINVAFLRRTWWLIFIVDLIEFEITKRNSCVWDYFQRHWNTDGRPTIKVGGMVLRTGILSWSKTQMWVEYQHSGCFPTLVTESPTLLQICHHVCSAIKDCALNKWDKINSSFLQLLLVWYMVTAMRKKSNTKNIIYQ